jgi:hypothetical protein
MSGRISTCPNCGAPVNFRFAGAVQTTCEFCHSILVRTDLDLSRVGEVTELPPNSSPIQILTEGQYLGKPFQVLGRIIYEYDQGNWNEWHLVFNDGSSGWLSDAMNEYAVSVLDPTQRGLPDAADLYPGKRLEIAGTEYQVSTITQAFYRGVEGELPFTYWDKQRCVFADLRNAEGRFCTIDYSERPPLLFVGAFVEYEELNLKFVRIFEGWS